jgi:DnaJ-class molecular chaperone
LIHHPDKAAAGSDPAKFPSIQNAYECLSDPDQRADYDKFGVKGSRNGGGGGGGGQDYDEMFSSMFGGGRGGQSRGGRAPPPGSAGGAGKRKAQSQPSSATITVTLEELYNGKEKKIDIERARSCGTCKGFVFTSCSAAPILHDSSLILLNYRTGAKPKTKMRPCSPVSYRVLPMAFVAINIIMFIDITTDSDSS